MCYDNKIILCQLADLSISIIIQQKLLVSVGPIVYYQKFLYTNKIIIFSMFFEARLSDSSIFKKVVVDTVKDFVRTLNIDVTEKGISFQAMDTIHVAMTFTSISQNAFQFYNCKRPLTLGVQLQNLAKVLKMGSSEDMLTLMCEDVGDEGPDRLHLRFQSKEGDRITDFNLGLIKIDGQNFNLPEIQYQSICTLPSSEYLRLCKQLFIVSSIVRVQTAKQSLKFNMQSEIGVGTTTLMQRNSDNQNKSITFDVDQPTNLSFSANHLIHFSRAVSLSEKIEMNFCASAPLMINIEILKGNGFIKLFLAPRVEDVD